jgi:hypothetical protein
MPMHIRQLIINFKAGSISDHEELELFSALIKSGEAWSVEGIFAQRAKELISLGLVSKAGIIQPVKQYGDSNAKFNPENANQA